MRLVLLLVLLAPTAQAVEALEAEPRLDAHEARLVVRAQGQVAIVAESDVTSRLLPLEEWHGLAGAIEVVLRRQANEARTVEVVDASGVGLILEWPALARAVSATPLAVLLGLGCAAHGRRFMERRAR